MCRNSVEYISPDKTTANVCWSLEICSSSCWDCLLPVRRDARMPPSFVLGETQRELSGSVSPRHERFSGHNEFAEKWHRWQLQADRWVNRQHSYLSGVGGKDDHTLRATIFNLRKRHKGAFAQYYKLLSEVQILSSVVDPETHDFSYLCGSIYHWQCFLLPAWHVFVHVHVYSPRTACCHMAVNNCVIMKGCPR